MDRQGIYERLRSVVAESTTTTTTAELDAVAEDTMIAVLGFDSLAVLDLLFDLEEVFGVQITAEEIQRVATVGDLVTLLERRLESSADDDGASA
jgi:acyl carrier protein